MMNCIYIKKIKPILLCRITFLNLPLTLSFALAVALSSLLLATHVYSPVSSLVEALMKISLPFLLILGLLKSNGSPSFSQVISKFLSSSGSVLAEHLKEVTAPKSIWREWGGWSIFVFTENKKWRPFEFIS